jgi:hypothetical protein
VRVFSCARHAPYLYRYSVCETSMKATGSAGARSANQPPPCCVHRRSRWLSSFAPRQTTPAVHPSAPHNPHNQLLSLPAQSTAPRIPTSHSPSVSSRNAKASHSAQQRSTSRRRVAASRSAATRLRESMKDLRTFFVVGFCWLPRISEWKPRHFQADSTPQAFCALAPKGS